LFLTLRHANYRNDCPPKFGHLVTQTHAANCSAAAFAHGAGQDRVCVIALLHNKLCKNGNPGTIEFNGFAQELATQIERLHNGSPSHAVTTTIAIAKTYLSVNSAITIGLLLYELLPDSCKHAFHQLPAGQSNISLHHNTKAQ
jgi:two-component sensor histidine kinase